MSRSLSSFRSAVGLAGLLLWGWACSSGVDAFIGPDTGLTAFEDADQGPTDLDEGRDALPDADPADAGSDGGFVDAGPDGGFVDGGVDAGADAGRINPLCQFGGQQTQGFGEPCGCGPDCVATASTCARNVIIRQPLADSYCTSGCASDADCPSGFGCWTLPPAPFCERCAAAPGSRTIDEACICDADCGSVLVDNQPVALSCRNDRCTRVGCIPVVNRGCPPSYQCQLVGTETQCVRCINATPASRYQPCSCQNDCARSLDCVDGRCRERCTADSDCLSGEDCEIALVGSGYCRQPPSQCDPSADRALGLPCRCNAECSAAAPQCLIQSITSSIGVGFCSIRPCDRSQPSPCGSSGFSCCEIPLLFPPSCVSGVVAVGLRALTATCAP